MDLFKLPREAVKLQWRLIRLPLTIVETLTQQQPRSGSRTDEARAAFAEDAKGRVKAVAGTVLGDDDLLAEGRMQQRKAEEVGDAAAREAVAERREREARGEFAERQGTVQRAKVDAGREAATEKARIEREKQQALDQVEAEADRREAETRQRASARAAAVTQEAAAAREKRSARISSAAKTESAAERAHDRAEEIETARKAR